MRCTSCSRSFRASPRQRGPLCLPCWRCSKRGHRVRALFKSFDLLAHNGRATVRGVTAHLGVHRSTYFRFRTCERPMSTERVLALADYVAVLLYDCEADRLSGKPLMIARPPSRKKAPRVIATVAPPVPPVAAPPPPAWAISANSCARRVGRLRAAACSFAKWSGVRHFGGGFFAR